MANVARAILRAPFSRRALREIAYCGAGGALGVAGFAVIVALLVPGAVFTITIIGTVIGLLLIVLALRAARVFGAADRRLMAWLSGSAVPAPPPFRPGSGPLDRLDRRLRDRDGWRAVAYGLVKFPLSLVQWYAVGVWIDGLVNLVYPLVWAGFRNHPAGTRLGPLVAVTPVPFGTLNINTWPGTFLVAVIGAALLLVAPWLTRAAAGADGWLIRSLLGPGALAERVRQLEQTRALAVDDSAAALRRVERDLHDGAQVRLAALALNLGMAQDKAEGPSPDIAAIRELLDAAQTNAADALAELRDLARGIHPPVLDNGLADAVTSLAETRDRPSPAIETIAYFCAAELMTNAIKHSYANQIEIKIDTERGRMLRLTVTDDGVGGADPAGGTGLAGLAQRVSTVDGQLRVSSPPGGPTVVTVELPLRASGT
jgi:signal transduction histidine kinase